MATSDFNGDGRDDAAISSPGWSVGGVKGDGDVVVVSFNILVAGRFAG